MGSLTLASASVRLPDGQQLERVSVHVRDGLAVVKQGARAATPLVQRAGVAGIDRLNRRSFTVLFDDGAEWSVTRSGCGCGR